MIRISANWEELESGSPEERATAAHIQISSNGVDLTENIDSFSPTTNPSAFLSAYPLATWFAWNWYRIRWEPKASGLSWALAHRMATVGSGFSWPNITFVSDGFRMTVISKPTKPNTNDSVRYLADNISICSAVDFERLVDGFIDNVLARLANAKLHESNLDNIWKSVLSDREDPKLNQIRKIEALLGYDADQAHTSQLSEAIDASAELGEDALEEVTATGTLLTREQIKTMASVGLDFNPKDFIRIENTQAQASMGTSVAWKAGVNAAHIARRAADLGDGPVDNQKLAQLAGVRAQFVEETATAIPIAVMLDTNQNQGKISLKSKYPTGRRFELARLIGDRTFWPNRERLVVATDTQMYRQKFQRAFAGELLCPLESLKETLQGDFSSSAIENAAYEFDVSPLLIRTHLVNKGLIPREDLDNDLDTAA